MMHYKKKDILVSVILGGVLLVVVMIVFLLSVFYVVRVGEAVDRDAMNYIMELSENTKKMLNGRIVNEEKSLQYSVETVQYYGIDADSEQKEPEKYRQATDFLRENMELSRYDRIALIDAQGNPLIRLGRFAEEGGADELRDICPKSRLEDALNGEVRIDVLNYKPDVGSGLLYYFLPYRSNGEQIDGVLLAGLPGEVTRQFFYVDLFDNQSILNITARDGDFLVISGNRTVIPDFINIEAFFTAYAKLEDGYDVSQLRDAMRNGETSRFFFQMQDGSEQQDVNKISVCMPFNTYGCDWYFHIILPTSISLDRMLELRDQGLVVMIVTVALFVLFAVGLFAVHLYSRRKLSNLAYTDPVTGGMNAVRFREECVPRIREAPPSTYVMVGIDVDKFKLINDLYGSVDGNKTLKYIFNCVDDNLMAGECVSRTGADKFSMLMTFVSEAETLDRLQRILVQINAFNFNKEKKYYLYFTVGAYVIDDPQMELITISDRANTARKRCPAATASKLESSIFYRDSERLLLHNEKNIENRMRSALENGEFVSYLQPKYRLSDNTISGAEALARWNDPERGLIPPSEFIPVFEKNGFIAELDLCIFRQVCRYVADWQDRGKLVSVSVNVSRAHVLNHDFLKLYYEEFKKYSFPPECIELELTESLVSENIQAIVRVAQEIHKIGFRCSLDDFGSGYSSLNMLKDIPVDALKLDRVFFQDFHAEDERAKSIIESVIQLAERLNMETVAEGIESFEQVKFLKKAHCDTVQGFVFCKPVAVAEFERLIFPDQKSDAQN